MGRATVPRMSGQVDPNTGGVAAFQLKGVASMTTTGAEPSQDSPVVTKELDRA